VSLVATETRDGGVTVLTLDRPRANAISPELVAELDRALREASAAPAVVLASSQPLFSAGWDLLAVRTLGREDMARFLADFCALVRRIFAFDGPILAALPGHAIAGGLIVAAAVDERIAAEGKGELGLSEVALGVPIPRSCYEIFRHLLGERGAERLAAAGDNVSVTRAFELGLVDRVVAPGDLRESAVDRALQLARRSRAAYVEIKRRARARALRRFDRAAENDPFLDFWFSDETRRRIDALVERLTRKS
jgi:enoyl-CoA hydratase/carnithine racemase